MSRTAELQFLYTNDANRPTAKWSVITFLLAAYALSCAFLLFFLASRVPLVDVSSDEDTGKKVAQDVTPRFDLQAPDFSSMTVISERKEAFFGFLAPMAEWENQRILKERERVLALQAELTSKGILSAASKRKLKALVEQYRLDDVEMSSQEKLDTLLRRVDIIPLSMVLAQAATESAWGTSRFAMEGNNYFGQWCFRQGCGLVPLQRSAGQQHEVAYFANALESVRSYLRNINTHAAYRELRQIRASLRAAGKAIEGLELIKGLESYSERGTDYIDELALIIRGNGLHLLDLPAPEEG